MKPQDYHSYQKKIKPEYDLAPWFGQVWKVTSFRFETEKELTKVASEYYVLFRQRLHMGMKLFL